MAEPEIEKTPCVLINLEPLINKSDGVPGQIVQLAENLLQGRGFCRHRVEEKGSLRDGPVSAWLREVGLLPGTLVVLTSELP